MSSSPSVSDASIHDFITRAVHNVCTTMIRCDSRLLERREDADFRIEGHEAYFFGCVGFRGDINGIVHLCIPDSFAQSAACTILGMSPNEMEMQGEDMVRDVVGEITNMTVGNFKNALCDIGYPCKLTVPSVLRGVHPTIDSLQFSKRHTFHFECNLERIVADIQLTRN